MDFLVLLIRDGKAFGPHFFLQVKSTSTKADVGDLSIAARFSADEVQRIAQWKAPAYLAAVDGSNARREQVYIRGIDSDRLTGIATVPRSQNLNDKAVRKALYDEVVQYFASRTHSFTSTLS
ncbi:hypothetical protein B0920_10105 [Massilia sp. KIM]|uniref:DUF4365 domain-containing protein n=1 Tax=Massilia sp. KIM TaxID=1955422 RepID=UPI00098F4044|nr:DUF4365 domain-containing protein [Massilia sp. KIM]OON63682.1 hypothetical protein B0920_10105 [Massilia sp. KIM]